jgi:hypothetical protein
MGNVGGFQAVKVKVIFACLKGHSGSFEFNVLRELGRSIRGSVMGTPGAISLD